MITKAIIPAFIANIPTTTAKPMKVALWVGRYIARRDRLPVFSVVTDVVGTVVSDDCDASSIWGFNTSGAGGSDVWSLDLGDDVFSTFLYLNSLFDSIPLKLLDKQMTLDNYILPSVSDLQNTHISSTMKAMFKRVAVLGVSCVVTLCGAFFVASEVHADTLQSANYRFDESVVSGGGLIQSSSTNYQSGDSVGDVAIGNSASGGFQINSGSITTNDPSLSFAVNNSNANFGSFSPSSAATATTTFSVSNYTSYGYVVQILGNSPSRGSHMLIPMTTTGPSLAGIEQFGINIVANTSPVSVGANPDHGQFGFGSATNNYGTSNVYRYVTGETIASAPKSSGTTTYTISYIVNVSSLTPGGDYTGSQVLVCTGTY